MGYLHSFHKLLIVNYNEKMNRNPTILTVSNALRIMEILSTAPSSGVSELARSIGCQKSTAFRLLNTLKQEGYVTQDENNEKYSLTLKLFKIGSNTVNDLDFNMAARPVITRLSKLSSETIHLCTIENNQLVYIQKIESTYSLKVDMVSKIGQSTPLYCTGVGKVLLAYQSTETIQGFIEKTKLQKFTANTIVNSHCLIKELEKIRISGIAYDNEEHELGVRCVAAPVFSSAGKIIAALSIAGPTIRMNPERLKFMEELVKNAAAEITAKININPPHKE